MKRKKYLACCVAASMMLGVASPAMVGATAPDDYSANEITDIENVSVFDEDIENSDVQDNEEVSSLEDEDAIETSHADIQEDYEREDR